ncbi:hypothetical protein CLOM_g7476 [Closterium sp. NIES-68]|nr:hypothetical protein CLOM_g7476 [Closterium sp. NIES-68]
MRRCCQHPSAPHGAASAIHATRSDDLTGRRSSPRLCSRCSQGSAKAGSKKTGSKRAGSKRTGNKRTGSKAATPRIMKGRGCKYHPATTRHKSLPPRFRFRCSREAEAASIMRGGGGGQQQCFTWHAHAHGTTPFYFPAKYSLLVTPCLHFC